MARTARVQNPAAGGWAGDETRQEHNHAVTDLETLRQAKSATVLSTAGMVIHGAGSALAKSATAFRYLVPPSGSLTSAPVLGLVAANTDTAAFVGTVHNTKYNVFVHTVSDDGAGTQTFRTRMGTEGATRAAIVLPTVPAGEAVYGITEIHPTGTGDFVGGTTALDDATVVPTAVYVNITGAPVLSAAQSDAGMIGQPVNLA